MTEKYSEVTSSNQQLSVTAAVIIDAREPTIMQDCLSTLTFWEAADMKFYQAAGRSIPPWQLLHIWSIFSWYGISYFVPSHHLKNFYQAVVCEDWWEPRFSNFSVHIEDIFGSKCLGKPVLQKVSSSWWGMNIFRYLEHTTAFSVGDISPGICGHMIS